jgi:hypothetical protein
MSNRRKTQTIAIALVIAQIAVAGGQRPSPARFIEWKKALAEDAKGRPLDPRIAAVFRIAKDVRTNDATLMRTVDGVEQSLRIEFSITTDDILLIDSHDRRTGAVVNVFHTDIRSLALRRAATGSSFDDLKLIPNQRASAKFQEALMEWDLMLPELLKRHKER